MGDRIEINDEYGEVISYGLRGIRLQTPTDNIVTVPHNHIWTNSVSNANMGELEAQVVTEFYLGPRSRFRKGQVDSVSNRPHQQIHPSGLAHRCT